MPFTEDLTVYFADWGVVATPVAGAPVTVIFDRATIESLSGAVTTDAPLALAVAAEVADWVSNETELTISGADYILRDKKPDGTGLTLLVLEDA